MFQCKVYQHSSFRQVPNCWPGSGMQSELGTDYSRPLDIGHSTRLPTRAGVHTSTAISTPRVAFESSGVPFNREGNREADTEGSSIPSRPGARPVHQSDICGSQKGRKVSTSCEPKGSEQAHEAPPLQNGRCPSAERSPPERGLDGIHRSKGCISIGVSGTALQTSPVVHVGRTAFSVSVPSIRAFHCPSSVHQGDETNGVFTATTWNPGHNIYRRYISDGSETGRPAGHDPGDYHPVAPTGVQHKLGQICTNTISRDSISGLCGELRGHDYVTAGGEGQEHSDGMSGDPKARESHGQRTIQGAWKDDSSITGSPPSSPVLSQSPASKELGLCQSPVLRGSDSSRHTRTGGAAMVVQIHEELERESDPGTKATDDIESDASQLGWGARCGSVTTGGLWSPEEQSMHINCLELLAASLAVKTFAKDRENLSIQLRIDNTTAISYVNRMGGTHSYNLSAIAGSLWQWCLQRRIMLSAEHLPGTLNIWADAESRTLPSSAEWKLQESICHHVLDLLGPCQVDLFATRLNHQLPQYVSWRPDPHAVVTDAFEMRWADFQGYAFP